MAFPPAPVDATTIINEITEGDAKTIVSKSELVPTLYKAGRYYWANEQRPALTVANWTLSMMMAIPILITDTQAFDRIGIQITTAGAAGRLIRLGMYNDNDSEPSTLIFDAGTVVGDSLGVKEIVIAQTLDAGWYWMAAAQQGPGGAAATCVAVGAAAATQTSRQGAETGDINPSLQYPRRDAVPGALPANFLPIDGRNSPGPCPFLRTAP